MLVFRQTQNNTQIHLNTPNSIQLMLKSSTHVLNCEVTACRARICRVRDKQINKREREKKTRHKPGNRILYTVVLCV